jgi:hypothetical protein
MFEGHNLADWEVAGMLIPKLTFKECEIGWTGPGNVPTPGSCGDGDQLVCYINALKPKLVWIIFKNSVRTAKKTLHFTITKINWLTMFKEIIAVCSEDHMKHINTKCSVGNTLKQVVHIVTIRL